ncbi:MAG: helix-turn-helix domain-containing protein, partial [Bacilli bacterium]|nr:helix-turn-helix domain-containing protein [Bacilli bacterium]
SKIAFQANMDFINIVDELYQTPQEQKVRDIANNFNCNQKQLFRLFKKNYGVSPKVLLNILRLHLCLTLLLEEQKELIDISNQCGFYDQAHFIKEIKRYTGISPLQLLKSYQQ